MGLSLLRTRWALGAVALTALVACTPGNNMNPTAASPSGSLASLRPKGQAANTQIQIQRFKSLIFRAKADGAILAPQSAVGMKEDEVSLETGDWDELSYEAGRLRYTSYPKEKEAQPLVTDRAFAEADFEALDTALWTDPFFSSQQKNWDANTRLPMFYVRYSQSGKGHEASFAPNMQKLTRTWRLVEGYLNQLSGESVPPTGVAHVLYATSLSQGKCVVRVSQLKVVANETDESNLPLASVSVDAGSGASEATLSATGFSFAAPSVKGDVGVVATLQPKEGAAWKVLLPVRVR